MAGILPGDESKMTGILQEDMEQDDFNSSRRYGARWLGFYQQMWNRISGLLP
jgi:pantothenate kinase-related protein Tda10